MKAAIFGAGNLSPGDWACTEAERLGQSLAGLGCEVWTNGNGGVAEAVSKGTAESGGCAVGVHMSMRPTSNRFLTRSFNPSCHTNVVDQCLGVMGHLLHADVLVFFAGGIDTLASFLVLLTVCRMMVDRKSTIFMVMKGQGDIPDFRDRLSHLGISQPFFNDHVIGVHSAREVIGMIQQLASPKCVLA